MSHSVFLRRIEQLESSFKVYSDGQLLQESRRLQARARTGEKLTNLIPPAFALVREAAWRTHRLRHFEVQLLGGVHLAYGRVIEMETGQGKTLTATLPLYLHALAGQGTHLATSNDYLAQRDAETMGPLFGMLGLTCGYVQDQMLDQLRIQNYACDITYGTGTVFGFDFLKDRLKRRALKHDVACHQPVMARGLHFLLADEADSLLIDDANTPMIIGAAAPLEPQRVRLFGWAVQVAPTAIEKEHYRYLPKEKQVELTAQGRSFVRKQLMDLDPHGQYSCLEAYSIIEKAILVRRNYHRDQQYIVRDGEVVLVNESTGRLGEGRQVQDGIHQLIQAYEGLKITPPNQHAARVTVQVFFLSYRHLAGMSGTVVSARSEFRRVYKKSVQRIATAKPSQRMEIPACYCPNVQQKWLAICNEIRQMRDVGRAVLVGTRSIDKSEQLSALLDQYGIPHQVLHARHHQTEAGIIAQAGQPAMVTVATGLAGRGTDIKLHDSVRQAGGLHVILTELHDSIRSDQQLIGRCARQGDPGSYRQFLCPDDQILTIAYGPERAQLIRRTTSHTRMPQVLRSAQHCIEQRQRTHRSAQLQAERRKLRTLVEMGLDPVLDSIS